MLTTISRSLTLTMVIIAGSLASAAPTTAAYPGSNGKIAYIRNDSSTSGVTGKSCLGDDIWVMNANGSGQTNINNTGGGYAMGDPAWSPDGKKIAYSWATQADVLDSGNSDTLIIGMYNNFTSTHEAPVAALSLLDHPANDAAAFCEEPYGPTWSPDGTKLAIQNYYGLTIIDLANSNAVTHLDPPGTYTHEDVAWAPFGTKFAVTKDHKIQTTTTSAGSLSPITWSDVNGHPPDVIDDDDVYALSQPDWSPDGHNVVFTTGELGSSDVHRIGILDVCGGGTLQAMDPNPRGGVPHFDYQPSWSPDNTKIAFSDTSYVPDPDRVGGDREEEDIWAMNVNGSGITNLTNTPKVGASEPFESAPDWQPANPGSAPEAPVCPGESATIEGRVLDGRPPDGHSNPLADVKVSLKQDGQGIIDTVVTKSDGSYSFEDVPEGTYQLRATLAYSEDDVKIFDVRYKKESAPLWVETEIDAAPSDSVQKDIAFSSAKGAKLSAIPSYLTGSQKTRLDDMANIFFRTYQFTKWAKSELGANLISSRDPSPVDVQTFADDTTTGAEYRPDTTEMRLAPADSLFEARDDLWDDAPENGEWHEFTHHLQYANVPNWDCPGEQSHEGTKNASSCDSFLEGSASFFPAVADRAISAFPLDDAYGGFGSMEANELKPWTRQRYEEDGVVKTNYQEDFAVTQLLWDLYDAEVDEEGSSVLNDDLSASTEVTYTDQISIPILTLWDEIKASGENPTIFKFRKALEASAGIPPASKDITIDLDQDGTPDVAPLDIPFLMHGFYPRAYDPPIQLPGYGVGIADDLEIPGTARNRAIGRTDRPTQDTPPEYGPREHIPMIPTAVVRVDVTDQKDAFVAGATAKLKVDYPVGPRTYTFSLQDGKADVVHLQLPSTDVEEFPYPEDPDCVVNSDDTIKVSVSVAKDGVQSKTKKFNSCSYSDALLSPRGNAAFAYDFTVTRDRSTSTSLSVKKTNDKVVATGQVKPAHSDEKIEVTLLRKQGGKFVVRDEKKAPLDDDSKYSVNLDRLPNGDCRIDAKFPGDDDHDSSKKSVSFSC